MERQLYQDDAFRLEPDIELVGRKSWVAYAALAPFAMLVLAVPALLVALDAAVAGAPLLIVALGFLAYRVALLRSYRLYCDSFGVWLYMGILPWRRGVCGVKWRDLDEATNVPSFWSWITGSYTVRVRHRFTKESEILLTRIGGGNRAVARINALHREQIDAGAVR